MARNVASQRVLWLCEAQGQRSGLIAGETRTPKSPHSMIVDTLFPVWGFLWPEEVHEM